MQDNKNVQKRETIDFRNKPSKGDTEKQQSRTKTEEDITKDWGINLE